MPLLSDFVSPPRQDVPPRAHSGPGAALACAGAAVGPTATLDAVTEAVGGLGGAAAQLILVFPDGSLDARTAIAQARAAAPTGRLPA